MQIERPAGQNPAGRFCDWALGMGETVRPTSKQDGNLQARRGIFMIRRSASRVTTKRVIRPVVVRKTVKVRVVRTVTVRRRPTR